MHAVHCWNSSSSALSALDDVQSLEGAFTNLLSIVLPQLNSYCFELLFGRFFGEKAREKAREGEKALNLGFICRPQTRYMQYFDEALDLSFVGTFGENLHSFVQTLQAKN